MEISNVMFALLRFELNGTELCEEIKNSITVESLPALFKLSKKHDLAHLVGDALDKNGLLPDGSEEKKRFLQERNMAVYRYEQQQYELEQICNTFEKAKIPFIPLKGSVLRKYYPEPWMRTSCDIDILVQENDIDKSVALLVDELQYSALKEKTAHEVSLFSGGGIHLELHFTIKENVDKMDVLLESVWQYSHRCKPGGCCYHQNNEFFVFHIIAHMAFHFITGGCGVRAFLDLGLLQLKMGYEESVVKEMCGQAGLGKFYDVAQDVVKSWFKGEEKADLVSNIEDYLLEAGVYGSTQNRVTVEQIKTGGKFGYFLHRVFAPYKLMKIRYPILKKHKWLLPFYEVKRWISLLTSRKSKKAMSEFEANMNVDMEKREATEFLLKKVGLDLLNV